MRGFSLIGVLGGRALLGWLIMAAWLLWPGCGQPDPPPADRAEEEEPIPGRWRKFRTHRFDTDLDSEQLAMLKKLESVGYLSGSVQASPKRNVTLHVKEKTAAGLNLYTSGHDPEAILMGMDGEVLHRWRFDFWQAWPDYPIEKDHPMTLYWRRAYLYENGDILAIYEGLGLIKIDRASKLVWAYPGRAHHDLDIAPNGDIYVLTREAHMLPHIDKERPVLEDFVSILAANGHEKKRVSLLRAFENSPFAHYVAKSSNAHGDIFHTNTLELLDGRIAEQVPSFERGNILTSMLYLDAIAVVDLDSEQVVWAHQGDFKRQHDPKILANQNLLLFDNQGRPEQSKVMELEPATGQVQWEYRGSEENPFYSRTCGTAERLPNGNTLITESDNGRAFEVTADGEIVWEFYNPQRAGPNGDYIATLFEMVRLPADFPIDWIQQN